MIDHVSPKQLGLALGVSEASIKRWVDKGKIHAVRTEGGHRRLPVCAVLGYLREQNIPLLRPEVLGLPPATGQGQRQQSKVRDHMLAALEDGDSESFRRLTLNLYLSGQSCADICDLYIAAVFEELGKRWHDGLLSVYQERRACGICIRVLHELGRILPPAAEDAPTALGAALAWDSYSLPTTMVELVLREAGWKATSLGTNLPGETIAEAIRRERPRIFWLSVSHIEDEEELLSEYGLVHEAARECGVAVAVGGRALREDLRRRMSYSAYCDQLRHIVEFAATLLPQAESEAPRDQRPSAVSRKPGSTKR
ncbi:MAG: DNA-binding protein [Planctomycetes bacterium]|nr:DNA-binding protein [Planctomycetota bacterium]